MLKPFLKAFNSTDKNKYALTDIRFRATDGKILEVDNGFSKLDSKEVAAWRKRFNARLCSNKLLDRSGVWRYREFLPWARPFDTVVTMPEGNTPIFNMPRSAAYCGMKALLCKHQGLNPTGSFKDNGMTAAVTQAQKLGAKMVACASTGNTSASMAAYAARAGIKSVVFIPDGQIAYGKLSQSLDYGAITIQINGDFDKAMSIVQEVCERGNIYLLNSINPFRIEGQKTIMVEMLHQLDWAAPDWVIVPGGNLGNSGSFGKAFDEMIQLGFIKKLPRIAVVQASGANPLYKSFIDKNTVLTPVQAHTRATAIKIGNPVSFDKALFAVKLTNGIVEQVSETEIALAKSRIGVDGVGCEPASATTVAGCKKLIERGTIKPENTVVCILTGNLLKDPDYTVEFHQDYLFAEADRSVTLTGTGKINTGGFANKPVKLEADADVILEYLLKNRS
ncbi:MAG: threonine synthase [Chitinivibrionales bacterium]|nr:threonine synthase [Chitinivibrionales bacterium]